MVRFIGMDVHREFAQLAVVEDGLVRDEGRIGVTPEALRQWAAGLRSDDQVALEATGNSDAIAALLTPVVDRVVSRNGLVSKRCCVSWTFTARSSGPLTRNLPSRPSPIPWWPG
jgi:hypothetical protein